jgi:hypothetical protein
LHVTARVSARRGQRLAIVAALLLLLTAAGITFAVGLCGPGPEEPAGGPDARLPFDELRPDATLPQGDAALPPPRDAARPDLAHADAAPRTDLGADLGADLAPPDAAAAIAVDAAPVPPAAATVTVQSVPSRGVVFLDGVRQCRTRCRIKDLDPTRVYLLSVRRRGFVGWSRLVDPRKHPTAQLIARLNREPSSRKVGYLEVRPTTPADVTVDGARINHVTSEGRVPLKPGRHEITLTHPRKDRVIRFEVTIFRQRITTTERMPF